MNIQINKTVFNEAYYPHLNNTKRFQVYFGSAGSGKSFYLAQRTILSTFVKNNNILVIRKYANTNRNSTFRQIKSIINEWNLNTCFKINELSITNLLTGSQILFAGLDDVQKLKSISGVSIIWIQQATQITRDDFLQLNLRLRGRNPKGGKAQQFQMWFSFNPVSSSHWLKKQFFDNAIGHNKINDNTFILHTTYKDNKFLDDEYITQLQSYKQTSPYHYEVYCLGNWGTFGELIYNNWQVVDFDKDYILNTSKYIKSGCDWGWNDPTAIILISQKDKDIYIIDQIYQSKLTNTDLVNIIHNTNYIKNYQIVADSAEPQRIEQLRRAGINCIAVHKKTIKEGINNLKNRKIIIHPSCINTIIQIQNYQYAKDRKSGQYIDDIPPQQDHAMDCIRYATMQIFNTPQTWTIR